MEQNTHLQEPTHKANWFDRHKIVICFSIAALFFLSFVLLNHTPNQVAVQGASTSITTPIPTSLPSNTPTPSPSDTPTATPTPLVYIAPTHSSIQSTQPTPPQEQGVSNNNYYINSSGNEVHSPINSTDGSVPAGATAKCADGTYSFSEHRSGTCSHHGGVVQWL